MPVKVIPPTRSAYTYPLLIKHLLHSPMTRAPDQEIVYRDLRRRTYREFRERGIATGKADALALTVPVWQSSVGRTGAAA